MRSACVAFASDHRGKNAGNRAAPAGIVGLDQKAREAMPRMRLLLESDPSIPRETRCAIVRGEDDDARTRLVDLGLNDCEAAELLDQRPQEQWLCR